MCERKVAAVNMTKKRMIILVKLRVALSRHASVTHHDVYAVRNVNLHLSSGQWTLVDPKAVVKVISDAGRIRAANLTLSCENVQNFILCVGAEALLKID